MNQLQTTVAVASQAAPLVASEVERPWPPPQGEWTYEDWLRLPNDGWQYQVIKGVLYMNPAPAIIHQRVSRNLEFAFLLFTTERQSGEIFDAPTDVYLPRQDTPVQPDLLFISAERRDIIGERGVEGAPDLVVEILSRRTWWQDRRVKQPLYEETGVRECWIVDPKAKTIEVYVLQEGQYALLGQWESGETARSEILIGFEVIGLWIKVFSLPPHIRSSLGEPVYIGVWPFCSGFKS